MISRVKTLEFDFGAPPEQIDAGVGRRVWLQHVIQPDESVIDLGGVGGMLNGWHSNFKCRDDLSGFGPPNQLHGEVSIGDIQITPYKNGEFDVAVMTEVLEHVPDPIEAMREAGRIARRVVITVPNEMAWKNGLSFKLGGHFRYYTAEILAAQLRKAELTGEIGLLNFGTWSFWLAIVGKEKPAVSIIPPAGSQENESPEAIAHRWAQSDDPLRARELLHKHDIDGQYSDLLSQLDKRLGHLESRDAYREFYATPTEERPFFHEPNLANAHRICPRIGLIRQELDKQGARNVLELGCFDGWVSLNLATADYHCVGVDLAPYAIAEARARAARHALPCSFHEGFIEDLDFKDRFDAVLLLEVLEHVPDVDVVLAAAERHLATNGRVYISAPLTPPPHKHEREKREHVRLIDERTMREMLSAKNRYRRWYQQVEVPDGLHHLGAYSLTAPAALDDCVLIVIPSVGQNMHFLEDTVRAIKQMAVMNHDILVLLDEPAPTEEKRLVSLGVEVIQTHATRRGLVPAVNCGFHYFLSGDKYGSMMLVDDSLTLRPGWDTALMRVLKAHPQFGWVSCRQVENTVTPFTSFCSLMSRAAAETLREFDLIFSPMHYDDADAVMRLRKAGFEPHGIELRVHHRHDQAATQQWRQAEHQLCSALSREAFKWRWKMDDFDWKTIPIHAPCEKCRK